MRLTADVGPIMNGLLQAVTPVVAIVCCGMLFEGETKFDGGADIDTDCD